MDTDKVHELFEEEMAGWSATAILAFENVRDSSIPPKDEAWARFTVNFTASINRALGTKTTRPGIATLQVFTPKNVGPRVAAKIADSFLNLLENRVIGGAIFTYAGSTVKLGDAQDWHQLNADIPFEAT